MTAAAPVEQLELVAGDGVCPRCGRDWSPLVDADGLNLAALLVAAVPAEVFWAVVRCWVGRCGGRGDHE